MLDEFLNRELVLSFAEARVVIEDYQCHNNEMLPLGGLSYRPPAQALYETQATVSNPTSALRQEPT